MWLTEDQARKHICPQMIAAFNVNSFSDAIARFLGRTHTLRPTTCLASSCALWRWKEDELDPSARPGRFPRGYCGLGGQPMPPARPASAPHPSGGEP